MPSLIQESKELTAQLNEEKKDYEEKIENLETLDKTLDRINEKRKKESETIDALKKQKLELQDKYYGQMIDFTKKQYLMNDIKWIKEMKGKLQENEDRRQKIAEERKARQEAIQKEREERKQRELERKQREEERKQREIARQKEREATLR